ncbi:variant erythrocyte surface antigen-1 family protein [Babesia caballi]|uniref:Variant erythrocyte surface antigen-1 family protein n=1 Tax=Babesia caballi TaxID=5871 RepID=A0AAV4LTJ5_BABCB|nr:variant erythrocyte surface antigen-1 family protein [Babesia caballi]
MTSYVKTSLTQTPENLKEAIDWIRKIEQDNGINELANALKEVLGKHISVVARDVQGIFADLSDNVILKLNEADEQIKEFSEQDFADPETILQNLSLGLDPFDDDRDGHISQDDVYKVRDWVNSVGDSDLQTLISGVANGLKSFDTGIMQTIPQSSAYFYTISWSELGDNEKNICVSILLAIVPVVYGALSYLYWRCTPSTGSSGPVQSWSEKNLTQGNDLQKYVESLGYNRNYLNNQKNGKTIVSLMDQAFPTLKAAYNAADSSNNPSYPAFLGKLQQTALASLPSNYSSNSPLTSLYLLSYRYLTYPLDDNSTADNILLGLFGTVVLVGGAYGFDVGGFGTAIDRLLGFN